VHKGEYAEYFSLIARHYIKLRFTPDSGARAEAPP
jgi:hypothetical protein